MSQRQRFGDDVGGSKVGGDQAGRDIISIYQDGIATLSERMTDLEAVTKDLVQGIKDRDTINGERFQSISNAFIQFRTRSDGQEKLIGQLSGQFGDCKKWLLIVALAGVFNAGVSLVLLAAFARGWL